MSGTVDDELLIRAKLLVERAGVCSIACAELEDEDA
jgi:hypothetical protein